MANGSATHRRRAARRIVSLFPHRDGRLAAGAASELGAIAPQSAYLGLGDFVGLDSRDTIRILHESTVLINDVTVELAGRL